MPRWARGEGRSHHPRNLALAGAIGLGALVGLMALLSGGRDDAPSGLTARLPADAPRAERHRGTSAPAPGKSARGEADPVTRPGATLHGTIRWDQGDAVAGAEVALVDERGEVVAEVRTDDRGGYALDDGALSGAELQVTEPDGARHERALEPLRPGEDRAFDVVLGEAREVVGWVLDGQGDPLPGVAVALSWEAAGSRWHAISDAGGQFLFVDAPATPLRVTADGGDLGIASARLARSDATRREVTLVLEPVGSILVRARPEVAKLGEVTVRCFSAAAHGEDGLWNDDLRVMPEAAASEGWVEPPSDHPDEPMPSVPEMEALIGNALHGWDQRDPRGSLVRMAMMLARADPRMEEEMRRDVLATAPELGGSSLEALAGAAADKIIADEPQILDIMGMAALKIGQGMGALDALMTAEAETRPPDPELVVEPFADPEIARIAADNAAEAELMLEHGTYDNVEGIGEPAYGVAVDVEEAVAVDVVDDELLDLQNRIELLRAATGIEMITAADEPRSIITTGRFFEPIPVRGAFEYQVSVRDGSGLEIICGTVFVAPGEEVEVECGGVRPAVLEGRVVDGAGQPIEGAVVEVFSVELHATMTDRFGRYVLEVQAPMAQLLSVGARDSAGQDWYAERRQQNVRPGVRTEVPDIIARRGDEVPVHNLSEPFGGIGASIQLGSEGIMVAWLFDEGPLALAGVEAGDVIVRIGEELGASLSENDALALLRGEVGSEVDLTLRSAAGELYELLLTRGLVTPLPEPDFE